MSVIADPLALYGRLIDKGDDNALARALSEALHETPTGLATEASLNELREETRQGIAALREDGLRTNARIESIYTQLNARIDSTNARIDVLSARIDALPNALLIRLGSLMVVLAGGIVTAMRLWPPH